jgi:hypothetical protein
MKTTHDEGYPPLRQALSAVHLLNLQFLVALRDALRADPAQASYEYGIDVATADLVRHASDEGLRWLRACSRALCDQLAELPEAAVLRTRRGRGQIPTRRRRALPNPRRRSV